MKIPMFALTVGAGFIGLILVAAYFPEKAREEPVEQPSITHQPAPRKVYASRAPQLFLLFQSNAVAAIREIGDAWVDIDGSVESIDRDSEGRPLLTFDVGDDLHRLYAVMFSGEADRAADLEHGSWVRIRCNRAISVGRTDPIFTGCAFR